MATIIENTEIIAQKGLSEWWNEETEYVLQRIEKWATFSRGYNRLRSQMSLKNRQITRERQESSWNISSSKQGLDEASPCITRTYNPIMTKISRRKSRPEEIKLNCCGNFNYQSNSKLDSNCLETYRYDHSIYFKTIGDIRSDKKGDGASNYSEENLSISSEELVEWDADSIFEEMHNNNHMGNLNIPDIVAEQKMKKLVRNSWPIVDLVKLDMDLSNTFHVFPSINQGQKIDEKKCKNDNIDNSEMESEDPNTWKKQHDREDGSKSLRD